MIKLVAFDWNGTILSDTAVCWKAANVQYKHAGVKPISLLRFRQTFSIPYIETLIANGITKDYVQKNSAPLAEIFHKAYQTKVNKCRTRHGVKELLTYLSKHNIESLIFSNHITEDINNQLKRLKIANSMRTVLAHEKKDGAVHFKNKGEKLFNYIKQHKFKPSEIIVIGDSPEEVEIGKQYGFITVAITGGACNTTRLIKAKPDYLIHTVKSLVKIVNSLNK